MFDPVDFYCERLDPSFWAEPLNAISNIAFIVAGVAILIKLKKIGLTSTWTRVLAWNATVVGIGSFIFHTLAVVWAKWADVLPIMVFMCLVFFYFLKKVFRLSTLVTSLFLLGFFIVGFLLETKVPRYFNGSISYSHALISLALIAYLTRKRRDELGPWMIWTAPLFFLSLIFRTIDSDICSTLPIGTHYLWHTLNGIMIWMLLMSVMSFEKHLLSSKRV